jgi:hypothetical protein
MTATQEIQYVQPDGRLTYDGVDLFRALENGLAGLGPLATLTPTGTADATTFLRGDGAWANPFPNGRLVAWVNFNGTGTVAIRAAGNVASITDNGVGDYTVNFTSPLADTNYTVLVTPGGTSGIHSARCADDVTARTTSLVRVRTLNTADALADAAHVQVAVFR